ncbi:claudin-23-like [Pristis pectinata]|uniref:claudin-23-like n=1 Tax=Pristis pectinata TaxID=685728 RepID=UPI00223E5014|nr:claudin-23-like [Pristis pectinata]
MRTPVVMILGLVFGPVGFVLILTCTVAPAWRDVTEIPGGSRDEVHHQGLWEICKDLQSVRELSCHIQDDAYFADQVISIARGLTIASLVVSAAGILVASWGVRCWTDASSPAIAGVGGIILVLGGVLTLIPVSWYTDRLKQIPNSVAGTRLTVGYAVVLGFIGGSLTVIGGVTLMFSFGKLRKSKSPAFKDYYPKSSAQPANRYPTGISNPITVIDVPPSNGTTATPWDDDL